MGNLTGSLDSNSQNPGFPKVLQQDLKDPNLWRLNRNFDDLYGKVVALYGGAGPIKVADVVTAPGFSIPSQTITPTDPSAVLTLGSALRLFSPENIRKALVSGSFQTQPTQTFPSQPLPGGGSGGGGSAGSGTGGTLSVTLSANTTITTLPPSADGDILTVFVTENATGGYTITWDAAAFQAGTLTAIDTRPNKTTVFTFVGLSGKWSQLTAAFTQSTGLASLNGIVASAQIDTEMLFLGVTGTAYATHWSLNAAVITGVNHLYLTDPSGSIYIDFDGIGNRNANFLSNISPAANNFYTLGSGSFNWATLWVGDIINALSATMTIKTNNAQAMSIQTNATERIRLDGTLAKVTITGDVVPATNNAYSLGSGSLNWANLWSGGLQSAIAATLTIGTTTAQAISIQVNSTERIRLASGSALATITADTVPAASNTYSLGSGSLNWATLWVGDIINALSATMTIKTNNAQAISIQTNAIERMRLFSNGHVQIASSTDQGYQFYVNGSSGLNGLVDLTGTETVTGQIVVNTNSAGADSVQATNIASTGFGFVAAGGTAAGSFQNNNGGTKVLILSSSAGPLISEFVGTGSPESVVTATVGSVFHRTDGGAGTSLYVKESGSGNSGWTAK